MRHTTTDLRCERCFLKVSLCMCAELPHVESKTHSVVIMHVLEHHKSTNTGRLAHSALKNSELLLYGVREQRLAEQPWPADRTPVVLFPVAGAQPVTDFIDVARAGKLALIALDANWRQAARLRKRFAAQNVPFVAAPANTGPSIYKLRNEPHDGGMSTYEAIVRSLAVLEDLDVEPLLRAFRIFQDRLLWTRGSIDKSDVEGGVPDGILRQHA